MKMDALLDSCITDYCFCSSNNRAQCVCDGITVFAKECVFQGISLDSEWRDMEICRKLDSFQVL